MDLDKLNRWLTLAANVGVMLGLIVLIFELNQGRHLARSELGAHTVEMIGDVRSEFPNEPLRLAWITAIASPQDLTDEDVISLDAHMFNLMGILFREEYLIQAGLFKDDRAIIAQAFSNMMLGNSFGRIWWAENRDKFRWNFVCKSVRVSREFLPAGIRHISSDLRHWQLYLSVRNS